MTPQEQQLKAIDESKMIDVTPAKSASNSIMPSTQFWYTLGVGAVIVYFVWYNLTKDWKGK